MKAPASLVIAFGIMVMPAQAVVVLSGGPNNTAPSGQPYFGNVGNVNGASGVYLGNRWVMAATHVAGALPGTVNFGGTNYGTQVGTYQKLTNNGVPGMSAFTDIALFRLASDPGLPWVSLAASAPLTGTTAMLIGNGRVQQSAATYWNVTVNPGANNDVWTEVTPPALYNRAGFKTDAANEVRWGVNYIEAVGLDVNNNTLLDPRDVRSFTTLFGGSIALPGVFTHEAQAVVGDSGGAVFSQDGSNWRLSGMMHAVDGYETQPANTAVLGQSTYSADLSFYSSQILSITQIPEPAVLVWMMLGTGALLARRRRTTAQAHMP